MKKILCIAGIIAYSMLNAQSGFPTGFSNWSVPTGGYNDGTNRGYNTSGFSFFNTTYVGAQNWNTMDMNGDGKPDLVVCAEAVASGSVASVFGLGGSPYWKVYLNNGSGFSSSATNWAVPTSSTYNGYYATTYYSGTTTYQGNENWSTMDMNGDNKPDLVVTGRCVSNGTVVSVFGLGSSPYWKVYLNTGSGFSGTAINWPVPASTNNDGYFAVGYTSSGTTYMGNQNWSTADMDGDSKPDLVVTAQCLSNGTENVAFNASTSNPNWKVYLNNGSGFSATATNWAIPVGGVNYGSTFKGFHALSYYNTSVTSASVQYWQTMDMNSDAKPDLVVTAQCVTSGSQAAVFNPGSAAFWKVYLNNGSGFSAAATNWSVPDGGIKYASVNVGYNGTSYMMVSTTAAGVQNWSTLDLNNDGKLDLIVTAECLSDGTTPVVFNVSSSPNWKVYYGTGTGFSSSAANWSVPVGGTGNGTSPFGYFSTGYSFLSTTFINNQNWNTMDIDGNGSSDLVVFSSALASGSVASVFNVSSSPNWRVHFNSAGVGVKETDKKTSGYDVFPVPSAGLYFISGVAENTSVEVFNILGKSILKKNLTDGKIDLCDQINGVYFLKINNVTKKIIKE